MTAAVLRPPQPELFRHLIATRPEQRDHGIAPTALALLFHVSVVGAFIWASSEIHHAVAVDREKTTPLIIPVTPTTETETRAPVTPMRNLSVGRASGPALPVPGPIPFDIPAPTPNPGFAPPGDSPATMGNAGSVTTPGTGGANGSSDFVPVAAVMPRLINSSDVKQALERTYPPLLRDAGIGGKALLWLYIDENGRVVKSSVQESSGQSALDEAALKIASLMKFSPARNGDTPVRVMVAMPVIFAAR